MSAKPLQRKVRPSIMEVKGIVRLSTYVLHSGFGENKIKISRDSYAAYESHRTSGWCENQWQVQFRRSIVMRGIT
jgi:hypothetical protein